MTWDEAIERIFDDKRFRAWDARVNACLWMLKRKDEFDSPEHGLHCAFRVLKLGNAWGKAIKRRDEDTHQRAMLKYYDYLVANMPEPKPYYGKETIFDWVDEVLNPDEAKLIRLLFEKGLTQGQVAAMEGVTHQAISLRYVKIIKKLRRLMKQ